MTEEQYDSVSPITGNKCVLEEGNEQDNTVSYLCMESGFTSHENLIDDSEFQKKYERGLTELMISCKKTYGTENRAWYPTFMQMPGGMLYAEGTSPDDWKWKVAKVIPIIGKERLNYPVVGKENEYHTSKLDVDNANFYNHDDFDSALQDLYELVKENYNEQQ